MSMAQGMVLFHRKLLWYDTNEPHRHMVPYDQPEAALVSLPFMVFSELETDKLSTRT